MEPISLILGGISLLLAASYVVSVSVLTFRKVGEIFGKLRKRNQVMIGDKGFIVEAINSGDATHYQGIFNKYTGEVRDYEPIKANRVESGLKRDLDRNPIVIFD